MNSKRPISGLIFLVGALLVSGCNLTAAPPSPPPTETPIPPPTATTLPTITPLAAATDSGIQPTLASGDSQSLADSGSAPTGSSAAVTQETIADLRGTIVSQDAGLFGTGIDDYLQGMDQNGTRYGIASIDPVIAQQIASLRDTGTTVRVWGILRRNVPDYNNIQVQVTSLLTDRPSSSTSVATCSLAPRLSVGTSAMVSLGPLPNAVRTAPGTDSNSAILGNIPGGTVFTVLEGPVCASGYYWYRVDTGSIDGWTAEGQNGVYWLDPLSCPNGLAARLVPGQYGRVTTTPPLDNILRSEPGIGRGTILGQIPPGDVFTVLNGPECGPEGISWWRINYNGVVGWTGEGQSGVYWLEPVSEAEVTEDVIDWRGTVYLQGSGAPPTDASDYFQRDNGEGYGITSNDANIQQQLRSLWASDNVIRVWGTLRSGVSDFNSRQIVVSQMVIVSPQPAACTLPTRLTLGQSAMVTLGPLPNVVRSEPGLGGNSTRLTTLPGGTIFSVRDGPECVDGYNWWWIVTPSVSGWMAEGEGNTYWIDPLVCGNGLPARLVPGFQGRVAPQPPLANVVRAQPDLNRTRVGEIPPGGIFTVLSGPQCDSTGMTWWRVNYNGLLGWTAEGEAGQYWLEPIN